MSAFLLHIPCQDVTIVYNSYGEARQAFFQFCSPQRNLCGLELWQAAPDDAESTAQRKLLAHGGQGTMLWIK